MVVFRGWILALALFAGLASAQVNIGPVGACAVVVTPPTLRSESSTELMGGIVLDSAVLSVTSHAAGSGTTASTTISYSMFTNSSTVPRVAHINAAGQAFTVSQAGSTETQPQRVVRALYQTILGREPDSGGWTFWTGPGAPKDPATGAVMFHQMADGFYRSPEFADTGWTVLSIYTAVLGRRPSLAEWLTATNQIRHGVTTARQLTDDLAGSLPAQQFILTVVRNAWGREASPSDTAALYLELMGSPSSFDLLRSMIFPDQALISRTNPAFVCMLFYTILVRDYDQGGYDFWLTQATNSPGMPGIYDIYLAPQNSYAMKLAIIGQAVPPNPNLLGFLGSPEFQGLIR